MDTLVDSIPPIHWYLGVARSGEDADGVTKCPDRGLDGPSKADVLGTRERLATRRGLAIAA